MLTSLSLPAVVVDIETSGSSVTYDRIIEIGIVEITQDGINEWSTLINPRQMIPPMIQRLTGITNEMLEDAPYFESVAKEIIERIEGRLFIAHNVRFDYGFIRNEFARLAYSFRAPLMCTVKLSRALYPEAKGHSLEKIILRHQIFVQHRHRALDDAKATYQFIKIAEEEHGAEKVKAAIKAQGQRSSLPPNFDASLIEHLPNTPGVYYFWGAQGELLYVGKSISIRKRVFSHFTADHQSSKEMRLCQQTVNITFDQTAGELGALILESQQIKRLQPLYNRRLRRVKMLASIYLDENPDGLLLPKTIWLDENTPQDKQLYGLFASQHKARDTLSDIAHSYRLCLKVCGIESPRPGPCMSYQLKKCNGICVDQELPVVHNIRLIEALSQLALKVWPFKSAIAIIEKSPEGLEEHIIVHHWKILGIVKDQADYENVLSQSKNLGLDRDIYRYLVKTLYDGKSKRGRTIIPLNVSQFHRLD
ncbi:MAG: exonuclease domain-containing protein [Cellvibrio sp.]